MLHARLSGVILLTALAAACGKSDGDAAARDSTAGDADTLAGQAKLALPVVGEAVRKGDLILTVTAQGQIRTDASSSLKSESSGLVQQVMVRPGDRVRRGQPLMRFDPRPFDLAVEEAQAAVKSAR